MDGTRKKNKRILLENRRILQQNKNKRILLENRRILLQNKKKNKKIYTIRKQKNIRKTKEKQ